MTEQELRDEIAAQPWFGMFNGPVAVDIQQPGGAVTMRQNVMERVNGVSSYKNIWYNVVNRGSRDQANPEDASYHMNYPVQTVGLDPNITSATQAQAALVAKIAAGPPKIGG